MKKYLLYMILFIGITELIAVHKVGNKKDIMPFPVKIAADYKNFLQQFSSVLCFRELVNSILMKIKIYEKTKKADNLTLNETEFMNRLIGLGIWYEETILVHEWDSELKGKGNAAVLPSEVRHPLKLLKIIQQKNKR